jgi:hypothetical protein
MRPNKPLKTRPFLKTKFQSPQGGELHLDLYLRAPRICNFTLKIVANKTAQKSMVTIAFKKVPSSMTDFKIQCSRLLSKSSLLND